MAHADMRIEVAWSPGPEEVTLRRLSLPAGSTLADVLDAVQGEAGPGAAGVDAADAGVWGRRLPPETLLRDGDRVELYRPLKVDPKEARRLRYRGKKP